MYIIQVFLLAKYIKNMNKIVLNVKKEMNKETNYEKSIEK